MFTHHLQDIGQDSQFPPLQWTLALVQPLPTGCYASHADCLFIVGPTVQSDQT